MSHQPLFICMAEKRLSIRIISTFSGGGAGKAEKEIKGLNAALGNLGKISAAVGGAGLLLKVGADALQTASDIQEMKSKFDTVFGSSGDSVTSQLTAFGEAANRSIYDLQGFAAGFQDTFVPLGFARDQAAELSVGLVKLTEDLASFNNLSSSDVAANLSSALVGNHEAVRSFGIVITETVLKAELAANGWDNLTGAALEQAKVQARLNIIMRSTTDAQGDAIKTADSYANQVKGMQAAWQDFSATLGNLLLPTATATVSKLTELANVVANDMTPSVKAITGDYGKMVDEMIQGNIAAAKTQEELAAESLKMATALDTANTAFGDVTGTADEIQNQLQRVVAGFIDTSTAGDTVASKNKAVFESLQAVYGEAVTLERGYIKLNGETVAYASTLFSLAEALDTEALAAQAAVADQAMLNSAFITTKAAVEETASALPEFTDEMRKASIEAGEAASWEAEMAEAMGEANLMTAAQTQAFVANQIAMQMNNAEAERTIAANGAMVGAFEATAGPIQAFIQAQKDSRAAQGEWVTYTRTNAGEIGEISEQLAGDLDEDQRDAWAEILKNTEEGSAEWLGAWKALQGDLTATQRAELIAQRADLEAAGDTIGSAYTGSIEDMAAAKEAALAANAEMIASYQQLAVEGSLALAELSPDPEAFQRTLDYAVAIGAMTQEEADLREEAANTRLAIEELNQKVVDGTISSETAAAAFELLTTGQAKTAESALRMAEDVTTAGSSFTNIIPGIDELIGRLNGLDGRTVRVTTIYDTVGSPPGDLGSGPVGDGKGEGKAVGGAVFPNQGYIVGERGPEWFRPSSPGTIIPNNQLMGSAGMGAVTFNITQQPGESAELLANRISTILARRTRQIRAAGG